MHIKQYYHISRHKYTNNMLNKYHTFILHA